MDINAAPKWIRRTLPLLVLVLGIGATALLVRSRKPPERKDTAQAGMLVEVTTAREADRLVEVASQGTVQPRREGSISSQVPGRVVWAHPQFTVGGMVRAGAALIKLDPVDFKLNLERAQVAQVQAQKGLAETESNAAVARREWKVLGKSAGREASPLTLYEPQLKLAKATLRSAQAEIKQAQVNLSRTVIRAPFNLRVRQETVEKGQYVVVGQALATVYGTDEAEVIVPLPVDELRWIEVPRQNPRKEAKGAPSRGSRVTVARKVGGKRFERAGRLVRTVGEVDAEGRMSKVVVRIDDPYNLRRASDKDDYHPDFEVGAFVDVTVYGRQMLKVIPIPSHALRLGSVVWVAGPDDKLQIRKVQVGRQTSSEVYVTQGLRVGDRVVLTEINGAVAGMPLRIKKQVSQGALRGSRRPQRATTPDGIHKGTAHAGPRGATGSVPTSGVGPRQDRALTGAGGWDIPPSDSSAEAGKS